MELVVLSGKGGTGKTTIATSLAELADNVIKVDCDVDAPNLYLFYKGENIFSEEFSGGKKAEINDDICIKCGRCLEYCRYGAIQDYKVNTFKCEGGGTCVHVCPVGAIKLKDQKGADVYITKTDDGLISRAEMVVGSEGSGKLVTKLRQNVERIDGSNEMLKIVDGSPGIGCAVIASIAGCGAVLVVTEPTKSGLNDFIRVIKLCEYFKVKVYICINKYDINKDITKQIEDYCLDNNLNILGKIPYDDLVIKSINEMKPIIYYEKSNANKAIRNIWKKIKLDLNI